MTKKTNPKSEKMWVSTTEMTHLLGVSREHLYRLIHGNKLVKGFHYYALDPDAYRPTYRWHKTRIAEAFGIKL
ncbi:MAG: hypothetical protein RMI89_03690 [Gloeomargarita sp. SKYBB_i_bin120]|nr:helix-turn-helix domain-containing protein [Gloeomargarita sp. SKYG98]MCS7292061.1 helix-turn-helix domain-containing protein [Gloeomargarita sp. SKYB120]MDW8177621.1 hypothetical protein [Gloeomargarita sp. SKYBB_i_bin120]